MVASKVIRVFEERRSQHVITTLLLRADGMMHDFVTFCCRASEFVGGVYYCRRANGCCVFDPCTLLHLEHTLLIVCTFCATHPLCVTLFTLYSC